MVLIGSHFTAHCTSQLNSYIKILGQKKMIGWNSKDSTKISTCLACAQPG